MKKLFMNLLAIALINFLAFDAVAQIRTPAASPASKVTQTVGLTEVTVEYSRPGAKERVIFAEDGLVPFGKMWRTGANAATKITFSDDVKVAGKDLKAGSYAIITIPTADKWTVNFYPFDSGNWSSYTEKEPAASATGAVSALPFNVETFTIDLANLKNEGADLVMFWEKTLVSVPFEVGTDAKVVAGIERVMNGPTPGDYFAAASYYHDAGKDLNMALKWVEKATAENPQFWQVRRKALILADLGKTEEAIKAAKMSLELAQKAGNEDYVRMNTKSIEEWSKKQ
jgi:hypothetical protein